ncbi:MAG: threonine synthase [Saprospiraceae bacterium]|jgi:threonine synthase|nr:threonine synthase [Saprospiraceae bacterium]
MQLYSTNNKNLKVSLKEAVMQSLAPDRGLYMPEEFPKLDNSVISGLESLSFQEIAYEVAHAIIGNYIPSAELKDIVYKAINFPAPVRVLSETIGALELWHGPSLAFKDFGARFMAALMSYFIINENKKLTILVATSGDTGGAVAAGFYDTPGIEVIILYPSCKVSDLQEKQLTTLGKNITALEINGTFDDCQALVKRAFLDDDLNKKYNLSSANSINIARLIPQSFYYFEGYKQVKAFGKDVVFSVPSGNFGNLTAGLIAKRMGLPVKKFIAATNINNIVPDYLQNGIYQPRPSQATISNAMDVGDPSNFVRILDLYHQDYTALSSQVSGFWTDDHGTREAMIDAYTRFNYICDPHGAIGYKSMTMLKDNEFGVFLETAHPAKFLDTVNNTLGIQTDIPEALEILKARVKSATFLENDYDSFKELLLSN